MEEALDRPAAGALSAARSPETAAIEERAMADMVSEITSTGRAQCDGCDGIEVLIF